MKLNDAPVLQNPVIEQMRRIVAAADAGQEQEVTLAFAGGVMSTISNPFVVIGVLQHGAASLSAQIRAQSEDRRVAVPTGVKLS